MITIILGIAIGIAIAQYTWITSCCFDWIEGVLMTIASGLVGLLVGVLVALALPAETKPEITTYQIEALQDNSSVNGQFFLGSGYNNGSMAYVFYYEVNGMYRMKQLDYNRASIKYITGEPKVEVHTPKHTDSPINLFAIDCCDKEYVICVPKGTIKQGYRLDAK